MAGLETVDRAAGHDPQRAPSRDRGAAGPRRRPRRRLPRLDRARLRRRRRLLPALGLLHPRDDRAQRDPGRAGRARHAPGPGCSGGSCPPPGWSWPSARWSRRCCCPASTWSRNLHELLASAFFVENWRLALDSVDYYADNGAASVAQHFWSLSIQAQFYLLAPLLVLAVARWARFRGADVRAALLAALAAVALASFAHSVIATVVRPGLRLLRRPHAHLGVRARRRSSPS